MARLNRPRPGEVLRIKSKPIKFSYWPVQRLTGRYRLQPSTFCSNPFALISAEIQSRGIRRVRAEARSLVQQAQYMFDSSQAAREPAAKPLLLYYSFLNLAKAYCLFTGTTSSVDKAYHGLSFPHSLTSRQIDSAYVIAHPSNSSNDTINVFGEFMLSLSGLGIEENLRLKINHILPQIVTGHRLWSLSREVDERFVALERIEYVDNREEKEIWLRFYFFDDNLSNLNIGVADMLRRSQLDLDFRQVQYTNTINDRALLCLEEINTLSYNQRPSDVVLLLSEAFRKYLWTVVSSVPPYRRFYTYLTPPREKRAAMPQLLSIFAMAYYYGSITRYQPHCFDSLLNGPYGPFTEDFLGWIGNQFVYLMASEFVQREVSHPAVI